MNWVAIAVLAYIAVFLAVAMVWRSWVVWRKTGINPYRLGGGQTAHDYVGALFRLDIAGIAVVAAIAAFVPEYYPSIEIRGWSPHPYTTIAGFALMSVSLIWVTIAQIQMGASWRIGIDSEHATDLVNTGLFKISRNPIFLGMRVMLLAVLLVLPSAVMLTFAVVGEVLTQIQVRLEEEHLMRLHGDRYKAYRAATRRWL